MVIDHDNYKWLIGWQLCTRMTIFDNYASKWWKFKHFCFHHFLAMVAAIIGTWGIQYVLQRFFPSMSDGHEAASFVDGMWWFKAIRNHNSCCSICYHWKAMRASLEESTFLLHHLLLPWGLENVLSMVFVLQERISSSCHNNIVNSPIFSFNASNNHFFWH
jgi:hypothetical protein